MKPPILSFIEFSSKFSAQKNRNTFSSDRFLFVGCEKRLRLKWRIFKDFFQVYKPLWSTAIMKNKGNIFFMISDYTRVAILRFQEMPWRMKKIFCLVFKFGEKGFLQ